MPRQNVSACWNRCSALSDSQMLIGSIDIPIRSGRLRHWLSPLPGTSCWDR
jgi:hypothetical protein